MATTRGKFIVIDGGEGSGKTTVVKFLKAQFAPEQALFTREPGGSVLAEKIREVVLCDEAADARPETQFGLIWAARADHVAKTVAPALEKGIHVVTDRFDSTTYTYQIHAPNAPQLRPLFFQMRDVYLGNVKPDIYIFLDVDPAEGLRRVALRKEVMNHFDKQSLDSHERIRQGFLEFVTLFPSRIIDANQPQEAVLSDVLETIQEYFNSKGEPLPFGVCKLPREFLQAR